MGILYINDYYENGSNRCFEYIQEELVYCKISEVVVSSSDYQDVFLSKDIISNDFGYQCFLCEEGLWVFSNQIGQVEYVIKLIVLFQGGVSIVKKVENSGV